MAHEYHCMHCGKRMKSIVLWQCIEDNEALQRGETVTIDHHHTPDTHQQRVDVDIVERIHAAIASLDDPSASEEDVRQGIANLHWQVRGVLFATDGKWRLDDPPAREM